MSAQTRSEERSTSLDKVVAAALLTTYGYRKVEQLRGDYISEKLPNGGYRLVRNTLHTVEVLERDRSGQSSNPLNEWDEYEQMEAEPDENPCDSGWCGDSACYRCNPWGYPR
jgi:hypothetical protein